MLTDLVQDPVPQTTTAERSENVDADADAPPIVREEKQLLTVVLRKLDAGAPRKSRIQVDDAGALIELRDAAGRGQARGPGIDPRADAPHRGAVAPAGQGRHAPRRSQVPLLRPPAPRRERQAARRPGRRAQLRRAGRRRADRRLAQRPRVAPLLPLRRRATPTRSASAIDWSRARCWRAARSPSSTPICAGSPRRRGRSRATLRTGAWREVAARQAQLQIARDGTAADAGPGAGPAAPAPSAGLRRGRAATRGKLGLDETAPAAPTATCPRSRRSSTRASSS